MSTPPQTIKIKGNTYFYQGSNYSTERDARQYLKENFKFQNSLFRIIHKKATKDSPERWDIYVSHAGTSKRKI